MRRVLVTGGSGFIGTHLVAGLLSRGDSVSNVDVKPPTLAEQTGCWTRLDLMDREGLARHVAEFRPHVVYNLAAVADIALGGEALKVNTEGLRHLLEAAQALPEPPRLIHASTQLVAGPGYRISGPRDYSPYTEYGESKAASEEILWNWTGDVVWTIVRPTVVWGPWHPSFGGSTWKYLNRRWYMITGGKDPVRTYSYIDNLVAQLIAAAEAAPERVGAKMFYGGDAPIPTSWWLDGFARALTGKPARRVPYALLSGLAWAGEALGRIGGPSPINRGRLYRMTSEYVVPLDDTFEILGEGPVTLEEGIARTVDWLRADQPEEFGRSRRA